MLLPAPRLIPASFYLRPVAEVARDLLGQIIQRDQVILRITEVEAYGGMEDSASHCRFGRTQRNAPMWGEGGRAYVFLCYGVHHMLNVVTGPEGEGAAVLIRGCEALGGFEVIHARRSAKTVDGKLLAGPGKVAQSLGLDLSFNHHPLFEEGGLEMLAETSPRVILHGPRVGVAYAHQKDRVRPWRFALAHSDAVTHRDSLEMLPEAALGKLELRGK